LKGIHRNGATVIIATHDRALIEKLGDRLIQLDRGMLVGDFKNDIRFSESVDRDSDSYN